MKTDFYFHPQELFCYMQTIAHVVSHVNRWVLIILWRLCERCEPCKIVKITPCKFTCEGVYFCYFIGRQPDSEGILSRAVHGVCHYFTGDFLLLSHSIFLFLHHFIWFWCNTHFIYTKLHHRLTFTPQQVQFSADSFLTSHFLHETFLRYDCRYS